MMMLPDYNLSLLIFFVANKRKLIPLELKYAKLPFVLDKGKISIYDCPMGEIIILENF